MMYKVCISGEIWDAYFIFEKLVFHTENDDFLFNMFYKGCKFTVHVNKERTYGIVGGGGYGDWECVENCINRFTWELYLTFSSFCGLFMNVGEILHHQQVYIQDEDILYAFYSKPYCDFIDYDRWKKRVLRVMDKGVLDNESNRHVC